MMSEVTGVSNQPTYEVRWLQAAVLDLRTLFPDHLPGDSGSWKQSRKPRFIVERHARKLAWWKPDLPLILGDLPWHWVPGLRADRVAEVLIEDEFGGFGMVRHLFQVDDVRSAESGLGVIWGLGVWRFTTTALPRWLLPVVELRLFSIYERDVKLRLANAEPDM